MNLAWALERMTEAVTPHLDDAEEARAVARRTAQGLHDDDVRICRAIGENTAPGISEVAGAKRGARGISAALG